jgi:protein ImuB
LFDEGGAKESMAALVERLRARLGEERVFGIAPVAGHRPECATRQIPVGNSIPAATPPRPFWLLAQPESLAEIAGRPHRRGPLRLLAGPERIESGWWDQQEGVGDVRRDYFIALTQDERWAWVFRELKSPGGWFLHGWFG